jgi:hypothetical protein
MSKSMSHLKKAAPGKAFSTVWYVDQTANDAALSINVSMSAGSTYSAMPSSEAEVPIMVSRA